MKSEVFWKWFEEETVPKLKPYADDRINRVNTFRKMFQHLDQFENPIIIETGCIGNTDKPAWVGSGASTLLFDKYAECNNGVVLSVDVDFDKVFNANKVTSDYTTVYCNDSIQFLKEVTISPHLLYLDASELEWHLPIEFQMHHYNELKAIMPRLSPQSLVVVDDTPSVVDDYGNLEVAGKGGLVANYATQLGVPLVFSEYQSGWLGFPGFPNRDDESNEQIIERARKLVEEGDWIKAQPLYKNLMTRAYDFHKSGRKRIIYGEACAFFARTAVDSGRLGAAYDWFRSALRADPRANEYRIEYIRKVLVPLRLLRIARSEAERATRIDPNDKYAWRALGIVEADLGDANRCIKAYRRAVEISEGEALHLLDLVTILLDTEQYQEAEDICNELLQRKDEKLRGDALHCLAMIKTRYGLHEEAIELYKQALEGEVLEKSLVHFHMSLSLHSIGKYREGFHHLSQRKYNKTNPALFIPMVRFKKPLFEMQPPPAIVHVHSESGDGDNMALMRYIPVLAKKGYTIRFEMRDNQLKLSRDSFKDCPNIEVVPLALDAPGTLGIKDFDYHLPLGEIPAVFDVEVDTIHWDGPYLKPDLKLAKKYERHSGKIGIVWSAGIREDGVWIKRYGQLKSLSFELIKPIIMRMPEEFVSLQLGPPSYENKGILQEVLTEDSTWADTAAVIENLDLVITPDTGVAHLAGGMGKPCWIMMHGYNQGWHFMCERPGAPWNTASPWYPSVRLFRQKTPGDWDSVIDAIVDALKIRRKKVA